MAVEEIKQLDNSEKAPKVASDADQKLNIDDADAPNNAEDMQKFEKAFAGMFDEKKHGAQKTLVLFSNQPGVKYRIEIEMGPKHVRVRQINLTEQEEKFDKFVGVQETTITYSRLLKGKCPYPLVTETMAKVLKVRESLSSEESVRRQLAYEVNAVFRKYDQITPEDLSKFKSTQTLNDRVAAELIERSLLIKRYMTYNGNQIIKVVKNGFSVAIPGGVDYRTDESAKWADNLMISKKQRLG